MRNIIVCICFLSAIVLFTSCDKTKSSTESEPVSMTGNDGKTYETVKIGDQVWLAENLRETKYRNSDIIPEVTDDETWINISTGTGARCSYFNNKSHAETYGYLYNWFAVNDSRNIAPEGWHVSTDEEWKELEMHLGISQSEADDTGFRGTNEGSKLAGNASLWSSGDLKNNAEFGSSSFSALPSGMRHHQYAYGTFGAMGAGAYFWSATEYGFDTHAFNAWGRGLNVYYSKIKRFYPLKREGFSVG